MSKKSEPKFSRRSFLKGIGTTAVAATATQVQSIAQELEKVNAEKIHGPGTVPIELHVNGKKVSLNVEPRVTLLDALRNYSSHTGAKEVCDRGTCGACTVLMDGNPTYSCMKLAIEAQNVEITTVEGLADAENLTNVQKAFVNRDALMCGYCTPGFVMSVTALLKRNPKPTKEDVTEACAGNLCRCGTYPRVMAAALEAAGIKHEDKTELIK